MTSLSEAEIEALIDYTGMDEVLQYDLIGTPVIFFSRNGNNINHVTLITDLLKGI